MATSNPSQPIRVRVNRAFMYGGKVCKVGDEMAVPPALAFELDGAGKIERADREPSDEHKEYLAAAKAKADRKAGAAKPAKVAA